jgi:hypothetical protein
MKAAGELYELEARNCYEQIYGPNEKAECIKQAESLFKTAVEPWSFRSEWWLLLLAIVVFPAVLYGICRGLAAVTAWVWLGFRGTSP